MLVGVIFGLVTAGLLELWRRAHLRQPAKAKADQTSRPAWRAILRLMLATITGFILGDITAGLWEKSGFEDIEFGSLRANTLSAIWTGVDW